MPTSQAAPNVTAVTALSNPNGLLIHTCGPSSPLILNTNSSSMSLQWNAPLQPEYVITAYTLHNRVPSLKSQSKMWAPPSTVTVQFHTYNPSGILFYQINSVMTDFLVKLHGGLPWLIFDLGSGPAVVGSNSTRTFNDGQWYTSPPVGSSLCDGQGHVVLFEQASNTFYVTVDMVHTAAITAAIVPLLTMNVYFEGFPSTSSRYGIAAPYSMSLDGFDAVSVQNVGSTYIIVSWDLPTHSNGILINFSPPVTPAGTALQLEHGVGRHQCCSQPAQHEEDSPPGGPPDPESDTDDIVISIFINKIINPDESFGSSVSTPLNMPRPYTVIP
eukprot:Em0017g826a